MAFVYVQRILDLNLNAFVRYETLVPTASPVSSETVPVSTGVYDTATHEILASYDDPSKSAGGGGGAGIMVWRPTATDAGNVYGSWSSLYTALTLAHGATTVVVDTSLIQGNIYPANAATIPVGTWTLPNLTFVGVPVTEGGTTEKAILLLSSSVLAGVQDLAFENLRVYWETTTSDLIGNTAGPVRVSMKNVDLDSPSNTSTNRLFFVSGAAPSHTLELRLDNFTQLDTNTSTEVVNAGAATTIDIFVSGYTKFSATATFMSDTPTTTWNVYIDTAAEVLNRTQLQTDATGTVTFTHRTEAANVQYTDNAPTLGATDVQGALDAIKAALGGGERNLFVYGPLATPTKNIYNNWATLYSDLSAIPGPKTVYFHPAYFSNPLKLSIPAGTYDLTEWTLCGTSIVDTTVGTPDLTLDDGVLLTGTRVLTIYNVNLRTAAQTAGNVPIVASNSELCLYLRGQALLRGNGDYPLIRVLSGEPGGTLILRTFDNAVVDAAASVPTIRVEGGTLYAELHGASYVDHNAIGSSVLGSSAELTILSAGAGTERVAGMFWTSGTYNTYLGTYAMAVGYNGDMFADPPYLNVDNAQEAIDGLRNLVSVANEPTGIRYPAATNLSFDAGTRTLTITPTGVNYDVYVIGTRYVKTSDSVAWTNVDGIHIFYYDLNGTLTHVEGISSLPTVLNEGAIVSAIYWNATTNEIIYQADERHGVVMDGTTHLHLHLSLGTQWISGLGLTLSADQLGSLDAHAQVLVQDGVIRDEDLEHNITGGSPQTLSPIANLPVLYRLGASGLWNKKTADNFPFIQAGTAGYVGTRPAYNQYTGGSWQLTEVANNDYFLAHIFATNDLLTPVFAVAGINTYTTVSSARAGALTEVNSIIVQDLFAEFTIVGTIIYEAANAYSNSVKCRVRSTTDGSSYVDFRHRDATTANSVTVHGNLLGLTADDHTQYLRTDGTRALTGNQSAGGFKVTNLGTPSVAADAATKGYVDSVAQGLDVKDSVVVATTGPITLSALQTIDGHTLTANERVLVKDQGTASENGIYTASAGSWSRASDADTSAKVTSGLFVYTVLGTVNATKGFVLTTPDPIVLDTTALTFTQFSGSGGVTSHGALTGLTADDHPQYLRTDGTRALTGNQSANGFKITSLATPTASADAATMGYVDGVAAGKVSGPGSSTNRAIVTYNGTGGVTIYDNPNATIDTSGNIQTPKLGAGVAPTYQLDASTGAAGTTAVARLATTSGTSKVFVYNATPEGAVTGSVGDLCVDATGGYLYQKRTGAGNTGWLQFGAATSSGGIYRIPAGLNYQIANGYTGVDTVVGGFVYQPGSDTPIKFEVVGAFSGAFTAYLYDVGSTSGGSTPALRATLAVSVSNGYGSGVMTLTPTAVPSTNGQISTAERLYEVRVNATTTGVLLSAYLKIGTSGS